jgi:alpha-glucosidase
MLIIIPLPHNALITDIIKNKSIKIILNLCLAFLLTISCICQKKIAIYSPDGNIRFSISSESDHGNKKWPVFTLMVNKRNVILPSYINISTGNSSLNKNDFAIIKIEKHSIKNNWSNPFGERKEVPDNYNQVKIFLKNNGIKFNFTCRVYNEGVAFSYEFPGQKDLNSLTINDENIVFRFAADYMSWSAVRAQAQYSHVPLSKIEKGCERPLVIEIDSTLVIALAEAKLVDYARMKFEPDTVAGISIRTLLGSDVIKSLPFQSPWRVIMVGRDPGDLLEKNYLLLNLNDPSAINDVSWIKPGKVLREVTLTTAGAKAAIDFTSTHNMQYVEFDAGWYGPENNDLSDPVNPVLDPARSKGPFDLKEIIKYAESKSVKVLLYVNRKALETKLDEILPAFREWGVSGIKFGFVQVGTQDATRWLHESIKKAAEFKMVADVHDEYRPTGFSRTYPNFLTMEGIRGDEESPTNSHTLITMFTRMLAGQGDNTICYYNERVDNKMGSHASQLAKAVCIFSPLQFLYWYDKASPLLDKKDGLWGTTNYIGDEPELEFFNNVPTVWDETRVLYASIGEYGVIARRKGDEWFIGGINAEQARTINLNFSFLEAGMKYKASIYSDDPSVNTRTHVRIDRIEIDRNSVLPLNLGENNGFAVQIVPYR